MKRIPLRGKYGKGKFALVDDADYDGLTQSYWYVSTSGYVRRHRTLKPTQMHRCILQVNDGLVIDHKNGDRLDNRRDNLRACTIRQNCRNRVRASHNKSGYKGVWWSERYRKWEAIIVTDQRRHFMGRYANIEDAARAYNRGAILHHGEFARLNEIN